MRHSIAAVVLAYSRLEMLGGIIAALKEQSRPPDEIIIIDQSPLQGMHDWLSIQPGITHVCQENRGSAGGFCAGIEEAAKRGHDWVWLFDDDGVPERDALEKLTDCSQMDAQETAFLVSLVRDPEGRAQQCPYPAPTSVWLGSVARDRIVRVERATWLGLLLRLDAMRRHGLPVAEFFIWHEDQELTQRLTRHMEGWCVPESVVVHYQKSVFDPFRNGDKLKFLHGIRNRIGWIKLSADPVLFKLFRIVKFTLSTLMRVGKRKIPASALLWLVKGYFFRPQIRRLEE